VLTLRRNSRPPRLHGLQGHPPADQPIRSDTGSFDPKSSKTSQFSVIRRFIGIESHASESYYHSYTVSTSGVHRLASQICHNRLFRKKLQQNILHMISTEVSSLAAHNRWVTEISSSEVAACMRRGVEWRLYEWAHYLLTRCLPFTLRSATVRETGYISEKVFAVESAVTCVSGEL
jgi:hypothetical protein